MIDLFKQPAKPRPPNPLKAWYFSMPFYSGILAGKLISNACIDSIDRYIDRSNSYLEDVHY